MGAALRPAGYPWQQRRKQQQQPWGQPERRPSPALPASHQALQAQDARQGAGGAQPVW